MLKVNSSTIDGLNAPEKHKRFVRMLADNVAQDSRVSKAFIFGSCAKGAATEISDVDICIITKKPLQGETDIEFYDYLPKDPQSIVSCDLLVFSEEELARLSNDPWCVLFWVNRDGAAIIE